MITGYRPRVLALLNVGLAIGQAVASLFLFIGPAGPGPFAEAIRTPTILQPAPWTFSIWGVIFALSAIYGLRLLAFDDLTWGAMKPVARWTAVGFASSMIWQVVAVTGPVWLTLPAILAMSVSFIAAFVMANRLSREYAGVDWTVTAGLGIYAAWLTVATVANLSEVIDSYLFTPGPLLALGLLSISLAAGGVILRRTRSPSFALTSVWALAGLVAANLVMSAPAVAVPFKVPMLAFAR